MDMSHISSMIDAVFGDTKKPPQPAPVVIKEPILDIKAFMIEMMKRYGSLANTDAMRWTKAYRQKESGIIYRVTVTLEREPVDGK